jgi:hypothetical protein
LQQHKIILKGFTHQETMTSNTELEQKITRIIARYGSIVFMNPLPERLAEVLQVAYNLKLITRVEPHPRILGGHRVTLRPNNNL